MNNVYLCMYTYCIQRYFTNFLHFIFRFVLGYKKMEAGLRFFILASTWCSKRPWLVPAQLYLSAAWYIFGKIGEIDFTKKKTNYRFIKKNQKKIVKLFFTQKKNLKNLQPAPISYLQTFLEREIWTVIKNQVIQSKLYVSHLYYVI